MILSGQGVNSQPRGGGGGSPGESGEGHGERQMGTTSPPADIVTGEHLAGAHKQIELEISSGPLISEDLEHVWHRAPLTKSPRVSIPRFWGAGGKAGEGRYGPEASKAPRWSIFIRV